jgi:hypothetical protein
LPVPELSAEAPWWRPRGKSGGAMPVRAARGRVLATGRVRRDRPQFVVDMSAEGRILFLTMSLRAFGDSRGKVAGTGPGLRTGRILGASVG